MVEPQNPTESHADLTSGWVSSPSEDVAHRVANLPATDRYELGDEIARGGMGAVHRCHDRLLGRDLALKVLLPQHADQPHVLRRFVEEAQVGGRLQHPGIVPVHEIGKLPDGRAFFAMKLVEGDTLAERLSRRPDPTHDLSSFLKIFEQICQTVGFAHARHVIHRDLKPANVMVGEFGEVQVMDWGLAKVLSGAADTEITDGAKVEPNVESIEDAAPTSDDATAAGTVLGTYAYMSPEQASGRADKTDERGDVFGLGAILCEILTGAPPYAGPNRNEARTLALAADLRPALGRLDRCGAEPELVDLCRRCLSVAPEARPANAGVVAKEITSYLAGVAERLKTAEVERAAAAARARAERGRRRVAIVLAATVMIALIAGGGTWIWLRDQHRSRVAQTAQAVNQALGEARAAQKEADAGVYESLDDWRAAEALRRKALTAADQAAQTLAAGEQDDALRAEVDELLPRLRSALETAERNRKFLEQLAGVPSQPQMALNDDDFDFYLADPSKEDSSVNANRRVLAEYLRVFREFGIDIAQLPPGQAAQALERDPIRNGLVSALTDLLDNTAPGPRREHLEAIYLLVERDPFRRRVIETVRKGDRDELLALALEEQSPNLPLPLVFMVANALYDRQEVAAASALLRRTQTARPGSAALNDLLATFFLFTGSRTPVRVAEAARYYTAALVIKPSSYGARINLGDALTFLGVYDEAIEHYRLALAAQPNLVYARTKLAVALAIAGYHDEAFAESQKARDMRPGSAWVQESHGSVCLMLARYPEAKEAQRAAIALSPKTSTYHSSLAQTLSSLGKHDEAIAELTEAVRLKPSGTTYSRLSEAHLQRNYSEDLSAARAAAQEAVRLQPGSVQALLAMASVHDREGRRELALERLRDAVGVGPHDAGAWWRLGEMLRRDGRLDEALHILQETLRRAPPSGPRRASILIDLGRIQESRGDYDAAEKSFREAMALPATAFVAVNELINLMMKRGRVGDAVSIAENVLKSNPAAQSVRLKLIDILEKQKRLKDAIAQCTTDVVAAEPVFVRRHAKLLLDHDSAEDALDSVRPLTRNRTGNINAAAWQLRGAALAKLGRLDEALNAYSLVISAPPSSDFSFASASLEYGDLLLQRHRENGSPPGDTDRARGHAYRGWAFKDLGRPFAAADEYRAAIAANRNEQRNHVSLAEALLEIGQPAEALKAVQAAQKLTVDEPKVLEMRAKCLLAIDDVAGACDAYKQAVADEDGSKYLLAYGDCLVRAGRFDDARGQFERAKSAANVSRCDALQSLDAKADDFVGGKPTVPPEQLVDLAAIELARNRPLASARFFRDAIESRRLTVADPRWLDAIIAAARAGSGIGDAATLGPTQRAEWYKIARVWVRSALDEMPIRQLQGFGKSSNHLATLARLRHSRLLDCVRTDSIGEPDKGAWRRLLLEIDELHVFLSKKRAGDEIEEERR